MARRLEHEWGNLADSRSAAAALAQWAQVEPLLSSWNSLHQLRAAVQDRNDPARSDAILAALVRLAAGHGDSLATRVVLQALLPGALRLARYLAARAGDITTIEADVLSELTIGIRTYPHQRRPHKIAANLLLDTRQRLLRHRQRTRREHPTGLADTIEQLAPADPGSQPWDELMDLLRWTQRQGWINNHDARLLVAHRVLEIPTQTLTGALAISRSTLYNRRREAEQRLRLALTEPATSNGASVTGPHHQPHQLPAPGVIRVAAVGDLRLAAHASRRFRNSFRDAAVHADLLLLAGDLTDTGATAEARMLLDDLTGVRIPVVAVLGERDHIGDPDAVTDVLTAAGVRVLEGTHTTVTIRGIRVGIAGVNGCGGIAAVGEAGEPEARAFASRSHAGAARLAAALANAGRDRPQVTIALTHYAPIPGTLHGEDPQRYPLLGSAHLGRVIDHTGAVDLAVHAHARNGIEAGATPAGVPVRNVAYPVIGTGYRLYTLRTRPRRSRRE